jgi:ATP-dependent DNA helicase RecQ
LPCAIPNKPDYSLQNEDIHKILTRYWGYTKFRPMQEDIVNAVLEGEDTLALLPTGGGKSICFQVPGMAKEGLCLVISPLISLMKDQVQNLQQRGIKAAAIVSGMNKHEIDVALDNAAYGGIKFLYVSPERLMSDLFRARVQKMNVSLVAVDEAHCISQWGNDFRPPYLEIAAIRPLLKPDVPIIALTATATPAVVIDIQEKLEFKKENAFEQSFERTNLAYIVQNEEDKFGRLLKIVNKVRGSGIVYARTRRKTKEIAAYLSYQGVSADFYHGGLDPKARDLKQYNWMKNRTQVMVATNAFGMGIDKSDVRFVVHLDLPDSLESYFQEAGRAGRDGKKAYAALLYIKSDKSDLKIRVEKGFPEQVDIKTVYQCIANHYQIAVGAGEEAEYIFDIAEFTRKYALEPMMVHSALKILQLDGYLELSEALNTPSKVQMLLKKEDLYKFQIANKKLDGIIKLLLRSYSGMFDSLININEDEMAKRAEQSLKQIRKFLEMLAQQDVIDYQPRATKPKIIFLQARIDSNKLKISKAVYHDRKKNALTRMESVIDFVSTTSKCRSQFLLAYFGQKDAPRCGICDVCLERNKLELSNLEFEQVSEQIKSLLDEEHRTLTKLVNDINGRDDKIIKVIQWLNDNGKLKVDISGKYYWKH